MNKRVLFKTSTLEVQFRRSRNSEANIGNIHYNIGQQGYGSAPWPYSTMEIQNI